MPVAVAERYALVVVTPRAAPVVICGSAVTLVSSSARRTKSGYAAGENPVIDGRLDVEHGPDAAEFTPMRTTSFATWVITGPPESPEQIPVVAVCVAVKLPGQEGSVLSGWLMRLGTADDVPVAEVRP